MASKLIRCTTKDGLLRATAVEMTELLEEARKRHNTLPTATAALGRGLISATLLSSNLKDNDTITVRIFGDGPLGGIITQANAKGEIRGYVQEPNIHLPANEFGKLDVAGAVGKEGFFYVTKDLGFGDPFTGSSPLISGEIGDDLAYYLVQSEQIPSAVALGVLVDTDNRVIAGGGVLVQALPGVTDEILEVVEKNFTEMNPVSSQIQEDKDVYALVQSALKGLNFEQLEEKEVTFCCKCSKERLEKILINLGKDELEDILKEQGEMELCCHFCNQIYNFSEEDIKKIILEIS